MKGGGVYKNIITVGLAKNPSEIERAYEFIRTLALERHQATPPSPPQFLFTANAGGEVVGTIGLDFGSEESVFPIEKHWIFERESAPFPFQRGLTAEYGRWMARKAGVSSALMYVASLFAGTMRKEYGICEVKPAIKRYLDKLGLKLTAVEGGRLNPVSIPASGMPYYLADPPGLYMFEIRLMLEVGQRTISEMTYLSCELALVS